ncbi:MULTISPECIES: hypothetical protein [Spirulina sp. CCY15215]|uniref:hypothetical protein n=1 Tax=Spirulina sp. CCY15215 TaxID=2767591 RepID=UPI0019523612|nr:hypothetical protein [Spirulina major]
MIKPVKPVELFLALGLTVAVSACGNSPPVDESGETGNSSDAPTEVQDNEGDRVNKSDEKSESGEEGDEVNKSDEKSESGEESKEEENKSDESGEEGEGG